MFKTLPRRFFGAILLLALLVLGARPAQATHLLGGEMSYRYLDANGTTANPFRYEITVTIYSNGKWTNINPNGVAAPPTSVPVDIYNRTTGLRIQSFNFARTAPTPTNANLPAPITPRVPTGCTVQGPSQPFYLCKFVQVVSLPVSFDGYYAVYSVAARNNDLDNIENTLGGPNGGNVPLTLYVSMAPPLITNRSPVFSDTAVAVVCQNDTTITLNNAFDPDGDRLVYSFGTPYGTLSGTGLFPPLPNPVPYKTGYSGTNPFGTGAGNFALINASTGISKYGGTTLGKFVVAVDVSEYRAINGREVLLGTTRRDLQLLVSTCPATPPPVLPPALTVPRSYTIEEGQSLSIPISATQSSNHPLVLTVNSALLDGSGPFNTTFNGSTGTVQAGNLTGTASASGTGSVAGTFVFNSTCGNARSAPYDLGVTVKDNGCGGKIASDVFRITVNRAAGPTAINGPATVCDPATVRTYTASGPVPASYRWRVTGGVITSGQNTNTVNVTWNNANATGTLVLKGISSFGCPTDSVTKTVDIRPLPALTVTASAASICQGGNATLTVTGQTGLTYAWSGGGQNSTNTSITVAPTATTTYTVVGSDGTCTTSATFTVTVTAPPTAAAGPDITVCPNVASVPLGVAPVTGYTYLWSPATGLSSSTVAQPTVTLPNATGAPIRQGYKLTVTAGAGCTSTDSVYVTVSPAAVANAGLARTTCSGVASQPLGSAGLPGYSYSWSPATGLSSSTVAQPTVTLPNTTGAAITQTYILTATSPQGCTATSTVVVTISPAAVASPGPALSFCSGTTSAPLGGTATPVAGTTYSWSPATGLSNPNILNPTVTGTNTTGAPITTTYTLTATTTNGCVSTATVAVTINPAAVADAGAAKQTCSNVPVSIGGTAVAGTTYAWSPATGLSSATVLNPTVTLPNLTNAPITATYTLTATTANGCVATNTVVVTINPAAVADAGLAKQTCSNVPVSIGSTAVTGYTYSWSPATGLSSATAANPTVTLPNLTNAPIITTYTLTATTANGCVATNTVAVTVNPAAVAVPGADQAVCSGASITLGAAPVAGYSYSWSPATGLSSTTVANPTFTLTNTTNAPIITTYTLTATTANGCVSTGTVTVTVNPAAVANPGPTVAVCDKSRVTLGTPALPGYTYRWTPSANLSSPGVAQPVLTGVNTTAAPITLTYTLTATTAAGCVATNTVTVTVNPRPAPEPIVGPASVCPTVTGIAYSVPTPAATAYTWLIQGGTIASGQGTPAVTVNWGPAQTGAYLKVFRLNAQGCSSDTTTLPIVINQRLQTVRPTGPGDIAQLPPPVRGVCQADGPYTYRSGSFAAGSSYSWLIIGGTQVSTSQNTVTVNWNPVTVPTIGKIVVTETSNPAGGVCRGESDTLKVLINPSPRPSLAIAGPVRVCQGSGPATFSLPGGFTGSTYVFQLSGTTLAGSGNSRTLATLPAPGTYTLTAQETSSAGCVGPLYSTPFTVNPTPTAPTISGSGFVCNTTVAQQYTVANAPTGATYQWTIVGGTITSTPVTASTVTVRFNATGPYSVSAVEVSASPASCPSAATTRTILFDAPSVALTLGSVDVASNNRIVLSLNAPGSTNTPNQVQIMRRVAGTGTFAAVGQTAASSTTFTDNNSVDANANSYEYRLDLTNGCGTLVSSTVVQTVRLTAAATPGAGRNQGSVALAWNAYQGFTVKEYRIYRRSDAGAAALVSTVPANVLTATVSNTDASNVASGFGFQENFRVVAVSTDATERLSNSNEARVDFANNTKVYNIITPNRDGQNDVLVIDNIALYPGNTFTVFNRWGREVYKTTNYRNNWGDDPNIAAGQYFYLLTLPNGTSIKNWFEVVK
ncbi:gliding motility-associated C-terminal domain-containing protein [Hymenobacter sp. BT523]|uniref:T9SS type B sorting domain-containing protein n=1 Tax=Hymenobacter sp. BT523 TaxID=2795725 RepID=UPI0018EDE868|nr:gliding motility-associated C-terminal domain-containing protein [Hymenobacter sp. BT523]MBJ6110817.1 gliding motility-associated C-terminal domain-containing protein [Hymenobacter sp. BT523]